MREPTARQTWARRFADARRGRGPAQIRPKCAARIRDLETPYASAPPPAATKSPGGRPPDAGSAGWPKVPAPPLDKPRMEAVYMEVQYMEARNDREWKKGSAELLILSLVEDQPRHGYDIGKLIEARSAGALSFHVTSLYPLLYRLEKSGWIQGRWVEKPGQRRRRYYKITAQGQKALASQRQSWQGFVEAVGKITGIEYA